MPNSSSKPASPWLVVLAFAIVYIVWGSTYFFIQVAVRELPPMILGAFRFLAAGTLLLAWSAARGEGFGTWQQVKTAAVTGLMLLFMGTGAVIWAEQWLPSSLVAILISSSPFWFVLLDYPMWKQNLRSRSVIAGLIFGFFGVNLMFAEKVTGVFSHSGNTMELAGLGILLVGTACWAGGSLISRYRAQGQPI
ncbi:MAG TPA: EamA family transporter [Bacteroidales bacterium]|nr:EamA family transporter [Bacteroidales bacterium]HPS62618.1 EamA family transporter [Bacteroidales bacterium]